MGMNVKEWVCRCQGGVAFCGLLKCMLADLVQAQGCRHREFLLQPSTHEPTPGSIASIFEKGRTDPFANFIACGFL